MNSCSPSSDLSSEEISTDEELTVITSDDGATPVATSMTEKWSTVKQSTGLRVTYGRLKLKVEPEAKSYSETGSIGTSNVLDVVKSGHKISN